MEASGSSFSVSMGEVSAGSVAASVVALRREGCRQIQGFYFSKPLSPEAALGYMKEHYGAAQAVSI